MVKIGIFGATGAVGRELITVLEKKNFPVTELRLFASEKSADKVIHSKFGKHKIENADNADYSRLDLAFFAISGEWSMANAKKAVMKGCTVIDNSSAFRYDKDVPLVIPQINPKSIGDSKLIANPNCTTAIAAIPLYLIYKNFGLKSVIISTYQAVSGVGNGGIEELIEQTRNYVNNNTKNDTSANNNNKDNKKNKSEGIIPTPKVFGHQIAFNIIPHIDSFQDNGYTREEMKVVWETRKIFGNDKLNISCTSVRIPTLRVHSESITVETEKPVAAASIRNILEKSEGIIVKDEVGKKIYPMPLTAENKFEVEVGRIRQSLVFGRYGIDFFVSGDQLLRGAALNAVEIAMIIKDRWG